MAAAACSGGETGRGDVRPPDVPEPDTGRSLAVQVKGHDFGWEIRYPGADGALGTTDDVLAERDLHLPADSRVSIDLESGDYVYSFFVPDLDLAEVAVPDRPYVLEFKTESPGTYRLLGSQMCGLTHPDLLGEVVVEAASGFDARLAGTPKTIVR